MLYDLECLISRGLNYFSFSQIPLIQNDEEGTMLVYLVSALLHESFYALNMHARKLRLTFW